MRQISAETVEWFKTACNSGELSRSALARELCLQENWFGRVGRAVSCVGAQALAAPGGGSWVCACPEAEAMEFDPHARPASDFADSSVSCSLRELGPLSLEPVASPEERRRWEAMIETHHPEGWRRPPGGQVRYRVRSERYGVLGGHWLHSGGDAAWAARRCRRLVGRCPAWPTSAGLCATIAFCCFRVFGVKGLASRVLRLATGRIADDWAAAYGERPVLVQSFTGPGQSGLSYRAAGWKCCPQLTSGAPFGGAPRGLAPAARGGLATGSVR